jgi:hypothetical protein
MLRTAACRDVSCALSATVPHPIMNPRITLPLFPLLCLVAPVFAQGEIDLHTTAKKGATVWLAQETKNEQTIEVQGQEMETSQSTTRVCQITVKDVDDKGNLIVETKIARVYGSMALPMGMGDSDFDSAAAEKADKDKDDDDGVGGMGAAMTKALMAGAGKTFTAKVNPFGKVVELMDGAADIVKGASGGGMMGGRGIDEGSLKQIVESAFGVLPEKATAVGGKWQHKEKNAGGRLPVEQAMEMTLAKVDADSFEITASGTVNKPELPKDDGKAKGEDEEGQAAMVAKMMKDMKVKNGKLTATEKVSRQDGFVIESKNSVSMDVEMSSQMGDMNMAMKLSTSVKRTTADAATAKKPAKEEKKEEKKEGKDEKKEEKKEAGK